MTASTLLVLPGAVDPDPGTARRWLREELARSDYRESLLQRFSRAVGDLFDRVTDAAASGGGFPPLVGVLLLVLLVGVAAFLLSRLGANPALPSPSAEVFAEARDSAASHRGRAEQALAQGRWDDAVLESVRALAATLFERGLVPERAGVTVHEITETAAGLFRCEVDRLRRAAATFDETRYGDRSAQEPQAREAVALEADLAHAVPDRASSGGPVAAVPR